MRPDTACDGKMRVLLTVELDNPGVEPRLWNDYKRPDNIYPVTWIPRIP